MIHKKGDMKTFLTTAIILLIVGIITSIIYIWKTTDQNPVKLVLNEAIKLTTGNDPNVDDFGSTDELEGNFPPTASGGGTSGSSGGGTSGGSSSSSTSTLTCERDFIAYSLTQRAVSNTCNSYDGGICTSKTIECSIHVNNRDHNETGYFNVILNFFEGSQDVGNTTFESKTAQYVIPAYETEIFEGVTTITSSGIDGLANKEIDCHFNTIDQPYKEFCY